MVRSAALALLIMFVVVGSSSAFTASSIMNQCASSATTTTTTYLVPEQGRQLVAFSQDYLAKKAKESASRASILRGSDPRSPSTNNTPNQGQGIGVAFGTASKNLVNRLLGHHEDHHQVVTDTSTTTKTTTTTTMNHANYLVWELMHAYTRQESEHYEDDILFHQIVD
jgi:hypothetical protein